MGLTPRKDIHQKWGWKELNNLLKSSIDDSPLDNPSYTITISEFSMSKDEILKELSNNGYHVDSSDANRIMVH